MAKMKCMVWLGNLKLDFKKKFKKLVFNKNIFKMLYYLPWFKIAQY